MIGGGITFTFVSDTKGLALEDIALLLQIFFAVNLAAGITFIKCMQPG